MITKTAQKLEEIGYLDSWKSKLRAAKDVTPQYIAGNAAANALNGAIFGTGGSVLSAMLPTKGVSTPMKQRLLQALRTAAVATPATAASAAAYGVAEAPAEFAYTKGFVPSKGPIKSMFGYVQASDEIKRKYLPEALKKEDHP